MQKCLSVKDYDIRIEKDMDGDEYYILSFGQLSHVKVTKRAFEIIKLMDGTKSFNTILTELNLNGINISEKDLDYFIENFIVKKNLLTDSKNEIKKNEKKVKMWIHIPIIESKKFNWLLRITKHLISRNVAIVLMAFVIFICLNSIYELVRSNIDIFNYINSLEILLLTYFAMFIHEIGHVSAAYKYGVQVGKIGFGIYMAYLVFFVDMTNTWRLDKNKRLVNDISGIYFQLITTIPIYLITILKPNVSLYLTILIIMISSLMNVIPVLKMDGYWLLTDFLNVHNVQIKTKQSINKLFVELTKKYKLKKRGQVYTLSKSTYFYGIYSIIYPLVKVVCIIFVCYALILLFMGWDNLINTISLVFKSFIERDFSTSLILLNKIFILLIPLFILINVSLSIIKEWKNKKIGGKNKCLDVKV